MKAGYIPRAAITQRVQAKEAAEQFLGEFESGFCNHFESVEVRRQPWYSRSTVMVLLLRKDSATVALQRSSAAGIDWLLMVGEGFTAYIAKTLPPRTR